MGLFFLFACRDFPVAEAEDSIVSGLSPSQQDRICHGRWGCTMVKLHDAGSDERGQKLLVAEIELDLQPGQPSDPAKGGCLNSKRNRIDGGTEYWLRVGENDPLLVLRLCRDGRADSDIVRDDIYITRNVFVHTWSDGELDWRYSGERLIRLSPLRIVSDSECTHIHTRLFSGIRTYYGYDGSLSIRGASYFVDQTENPFREPPLGFYLGYGCPEPGEDPVNPVMSHLIAAYTPVPILDFGLDVERLVTVKPGQGIGNCSQVIDTHIPGSLVTPRGFSVSKERRTEVRFILLSSNTLLLQIAKADWEGVENLPASEERESHIRLWTEYPESIRWRIAPLSLKESPKVVGEMRNPTSEPEIESWIGRVQDRDVRVIRLTWPEGDAAARQQMFASGVAIGYVEWDSVQGIWHTFSNVPLGSIGWPLLIPENVYTSGRMAPSGDAHYPPFETHPAFRGFPGYCEMRDGVLSFVPNHPDEQGP